MVVSEIVNVVNSVDMVDQVIYVIVGEVEMVDQIVGVVKEVVDWMFYGIEGFFDEMVWDVEECCCVNWKQEQGQYVNLIMFDGEWIWICLMNSLEGGIGVMVFLGVYEGIQVIFEDGNGNQFLMEIWWLYVGMVGFKYLVGEVVQIEVV